VSLCIFDGSKIVSIPAFFVQWHKVRRLPVTFIVLWFQIAPDLNLGCAFRFLFRFLPGLIFRNSGYSAEFPGSAGTHVGIKSFQGKIICSGIPEGRTLEMVYSVPRVTNIQEEEQKKQVSTMAFCCQLLLPRTAASRYCCRH
jgi:hypothetical protein